MQGTGQSNTGSPNRESLRLSIVRATIGVFPAYSMARIRQLALKACGLRFGKGTLFWGVPQISNGPMSRLHVGAMCGFNDGCEFDLTEPVHIGDNVSAGHEVRFLTGTCEGRSGAAPIVVGEGVWLAARCTVLGGVTIGPGAIVGAGCVVSADVPANTLVTDQKMIPLPTWTQSGTQEDLIKAPALSARLKNAWMIEFSDLRFRLLLCLVLGKLLPEGRAGRRRAQLLRIAGVRIGRGTRVLGMPKIQSTPPGPLTGRLSVGAECTIGRGVVLEFGASLSIGDRTYIEDRAVLLTTTHQIGSPRHRAGKPILSPVEIGNDVILGEGCIILPGTTIGDRARVLSGSVVNARVAPGLTVGGSPARPVVPGSEDRRERER